MRAPDTLKPSRIIQGTRAEQIRVRADTRDGRPVVRLDGLDRLASHTDAMSVFGRALLIPTANVDALIQALYAAKVEACGEPCAQPEAITGGEA
jgi:hypothetical protein